MINRIDDLRNKEVICISDGVKIGFVGDVEIDCTNAKLTSLVVYGRQKFFGFLGREEDIVIGWDKISVIGEDTILVNFRPNIRSRKQTNFLSNFFELK